MFKYNVNVHKNTLIYLDCSMVIDNNITNCKRCEVDVLFLTLIAACEQAGGTQKRVNIIEIPASNTRSNQWHNFAYSVH
jgi:hypothetical protein